jgi:hypothetical protein
VFFILIVGRNLERMSYGKEAGLLRASDEFQVAALNQSAGSPINPYGPNVGYNQTGAGARVTELCFFFPWKNILSKAWTCIWNITA